VNLTLSVPEDVVRAARARAEAMGTSINQLIREYLEQLAGQRDPEALAREFEQLSWESGGDSREWKFNRDDLHERG
jgi:hypothetical protein